MRTRATLLHPAPPAGCDTSSHLVVTVVGEDTGQVRPRVAIVPVVDRSGSMGLDSKLAVVTRALSYLSTYLSEADQLALVSFDSHVSVDVGPGPADPARTAQFGHVLARMRPGSSTNLHGGIQAALTVARSLPTDALVRLVVLTDGQANVGPSSRGELLALVGDVPAHVSVSFLGVGRDCDHDLLSALATAGGGNYGFIENGQRAADVLGAEIGGLLDVEVRQLLVRIRPRPKVLASCDLLSHESGSQDLPGEPAADLTVQLGSLLAGQTRHVVASVVLRGPKRRHARPITVADVTVSGLLGPDAAPVEVALLPKVHFGVEDVPEPDAELVAVVDLAMVAAAQREAELAAAAGEFGRARHVFDSLRVAGSALGLSRSLGMNYADAGSYAGSSTMRSSSSHALSGSLSGSDATFDALAARTIGSYTTTAQRDMASATSAAVLSSPAPSGPAVESASNDTEDEVDR